MLVSSLYFVLLLAIALDNYLSIFKRVGHVGFVNRLSPGKQTIFWLLQLGLALSFLIASIKAFGYVFGFLLTFAGIVFAIVFYIASLKFFFKTKMRRQHQQEMAAVEARFQASQHKD